MSALLELLRAAPEFAPGSLHSEVSEASLRELVDQAPRHGLAGYVRHGFAAAGVKLPAEVDAALRREELAIAAVALRTRRLLVEALDALAAEGIVPVLLKGQGLAQRLYPHAHLRPSVDVDLYVPPSDVERAGTALERLGLTRGKEAQEAWQAEHHHHLNFYRPGGMVELHFRLASGFGASVDDVELFERAVPGEFEGRKVRFLCPEDELPYLAVHAAQHLLQRLSWLLDVKLLIAANPGLDWERVLRFVERFGVKVPVFVSLHAAREGLGAAVPEFVLRALRPAGWQRVLDRALFEGDRLVGSPISRQHRFVSYLAVIALSSSVPQMARSFGRTFQLGMMRKLGYAFPRVTPEGWRT